MDGDEGQALAGSSREAQRTAPQSSAVPGGQEASVCHQKRGEHP